MHIVAPSAGETLHLVGIDEQSLAWHWDMLHGQWMPLADEQARYPKYGENGKIV